ncbi:meiosis 1 arrest protein isoform X2 [Heliangelus exortis]|uniref:meiosis 1 arrest protein isoform X2 n=1 Tax=Heliangelus exortis TaxID=472823 RepID=UPI003A8D76F4
MNSRRLLSETRRTFLATKVQRQQPSQILIVDVTSPSWTDTCSVLSEALENILCLACSLTGPCRVPLLSLYVVQNQQECLLPFTQVRENFGRIQACISELRSLPREGCFPKAGNGVIQAVQDGLQQFKQYCRHIAAGGSTNTSVEITILTCQSSKEIVKQLEKKLKDVDLVNLRRIQVTEVLKRDFLEPEDVEQCMPAEEPTNNVCLKCDLQERLLDPSLLSGSVDGAMRAADLNSPCQMAAWPATMLYKLRVVKALKSEGVCESVLYGLPFIIKPTSCWQLDWDELETNQHSFHVLCHSLLKRQWMLLAKREPQDPGANWNIMVHSYYVIVPSDSASLLIKAIAIRELLLPSTFPALLAEHPERVQGPIESALNSLEVEVAYNPLHLKSNLYKYLKSMLYKPLPRQQVQPRDQRPERHQPKQHSSRAKATVAPLLMAPSPVQAFRPAAGRRDGCEHSLSPREYEEFLQ